MIQLVFADSLVPQPSVLGPAPWFKVGGNFMRVGPHGAIAGTYRLHHWEVQSQHYTRWDCRGQSWVHFEDALGGNTEVFGPFEEVYAADGVMHADGKLFAKFIEETQLWHCYPSENFWPVMVIKSAADLLPSGSIRP